MKHARSVSVLAAWWVLASVTVANAQTGAVDLMGATGGGRNVVAPTSGPMIAPMSRPVDPVEYVVGPGDMLQLNLSGGVTRSWETMILPEGTLYVPSIGPIPLIGLSLAVRIGIRLTTHLNSFSIYVLTPCHLDGIAMGSLLAALAQEPRGLAPLGRAARIAAWILGPSSLLLALTESVLHPNDFGVGFSPIFNTVGFTLLALFFGALLTSVLTSASGSALGRVFASGALRTFGKYSYGLYLIHLPLRAVIRDRLFPHLPKVLRSELPGQLFFYAVAGAASLGAAWLSFHLFEKHFLKLKRLFPPSAPNAEEARFAAG